MTRLTLAELEIERKDGFEIEIGDTVFVFADPKGIQANSLIALESLSAVEQLQTVLGEKSDEFLNHPAVDGYVLDAVLTRYMSHYGLATPPEGRGSRTSSRGLASTSKRTSQSRTSR